MISWRYILPLMGGFLAMAAHVYLAYGLGDWFAPQRFRDALGIGLIFGHLVALMIFCSRDLPQHLKWPVWIKYPLAISLSIFIGTVAWWVHNTFFLLNTAPNWGILILGGITLSAGFWFPFQTHNPIIFLGVTSLTTLVIFAPIYFTFQSFPETFMTPQPAATLLYFQPDNPEFVWLIGLPFAGCIAFFGHLAAIFLRRP